jgi:hypothetical protein
MKTEVYSWRLSAGKKAELETAAKREGTSLAGLLDRITAKWLEDRRNGDEAKQAALRRRVMKTVGTIRGGDPTRASRARELVRATLVHLAARESLSLILTVDHDDFETYRIGGRKRFTILPRRNQRSL